VVKTVMAQPGVDVDLLIHDDNCNFEKNVDKNDAEAFKHVKYYIVDFCHRCNHKCSKRKLTAAEKRRSKNVNTAIAESFNAWIRAANFFLNGLRPSSHRFWVDEFIRFYNVHCAKPGGKKLFRRTNAKARALRKRPASR
jgi:hypothetical protein